MNTINPVYYKFKNISTSLHGDEFLSEVQLYYSFILQRLFHTRGQIYELCSFTTETVCMHKDRDMHMQYFLLIFKDTHMPTYVF